MVSAIKNWHINNRKITRKYSCLIFICKHNCKLDSFVNNPWLKGQSKENEKIF